MLWYLGNCRPFNASYIRLYIETVLHRSILHKPMSYLNYTNDRLLETPSFLRITPQSKLDLIEKFIHFAENQLGQTYDHVAKTDRDHKYLAEGWQKLLTLDKDISRI